ncbi:MAG: hypothetical protein E7L17_14910 [Clostridium sp.]|uniref:hypothetical protein n=1 Tax=Clostridium sp. TaxID=1506 RepID=UPI0029083522|nr:hypothetical protein [Clostridium sp.]MDU7339392.1 hypothetical protein [Clostridium sp.]
MYSIRFSYFDGTVIDCNNVTSARSMKVEETYTGDLILSGYYPLSSSYWIKTEKESYSISGENLKTIFVSKN